MQTVKLTAGTFFQLPGESVWRVSEKTAARLGDGLPPPGRERRILWRGRLWWLRRRQGGKGVIWTVTWSGCVVVEKPLRLVQPSELVYRDGWVLTLRYDRDRGSDMQDRVYPSREDPDGGPMALVVLRLPPDRDSRYGDPNEPAPEEAS